MIGDDTIEALEECPNAAEAVGVISSGAQNPGNAVLFEGAGPQAELKAAGVKAGANGLEMDALTGEVFGESVFEFELRLVRGDFGQKMERGGEERARPSGQARGGAIEERVTDGDGVGVAGVEKEAFMMSVRHEVDAGTGAAGGDHLGDGAREAAPAVAPGGGAHGGRREAQGAGDLMAGAVIVGLAAEGELGRGRKAGNQPGDLLDEFRDGSVEHVGAGRLGDQ